VRLQDALKFPLIGSAVLVGLFCLFKFLPKDLVNAVLTAYFVLLGTFAITAAMLPFIEPLVPKRLRERSLEYKQFSMPYFCKVRLLAPPLSSLHAGAMRSFCMPTHGASMLAAWCHTQEPIDLSATLPECIGGVLSLAFCCWYYAKKHWLANNVLGICFSIEGIEHLSLGSIQTGAILLSGLFFYDIFWVFCTPVMVRSSILHYAADPPAGQRGCCFGAYMGYHGETLACAAGDGGKVVRCTYQAAVPAGCG
jgi:minor histocompatibility antigen H13